jgi:hypothetical protein
MNTFDLWKISILNLYVMDSRNILKLPGPNSNFQNLQNVNRKVPKAQKLSSSDLINGNKS